MAVKPSDLVLHLGGAALARYGTLVRHTSTVEELAETFTRTGNARWIDRGGVLRIAEADTPRVVHLLDGSERSVVAWRLEGQRTNKCHRGYNFNANGTAGWTLSGDASATLTAVDDSTELAAAGLAGIVTDGFVLRLDNSAGASTAWAANDGTVLGDTNPHTISAYLRGSGAARLILTTQDGDSANISLTGDYVRYTQTVTPGAGTRYPLVRAEAGADVYFVLPQMEAGSFATSVVPNDAASTATRNAETAYIDLPPAIAAPGVALSVYAKFRLPYTNSGIASFFPRVWAVGGDSDAGGAVSLFMSPAVSAAVLKMHDGSSGTTLLLTSFGPTAGQTIELACSVDTDGDGVIEGSIDSGAATSNTGSLGSFPTAWANQRFYVGGDSSEAGFTDLIDLKVTKNVYTLSELREAAR